MCIYFVLNKYYYIIILYGGSHASDILHVLMGVSVAKLIIYNIVLLFICHNKRSSYSSSSWYKKYPPGSLSVSTVCAVIRRSSHGVCAGHSTIVVRRLHRRRSSCRRKLHGVCLALETKATWGKRTCPRFETASVGPLDLETCALTHLATAQTHEM